LEAAAQRPPPAIANPGRASGVLCHDRRFVLVLAIHLHLHLLHHKGAAIDYVGLAAAAFASWVIWVGPGEPAMIAAGIVAAKHRLDIAPVVFWGWIGAMLGGIVGWLIGLRAGRAVLTAPGPFQRLRVRVADQGERIFHRMEVLAIIATPPWVAGINRSRPAVYLPVNALSALVLWAAPLGIGAYYAGPVVLDLFGDAGTLLSVLLVAGVVAVLGAELMRRRRARHPGRTDEA
jgi:membrane protein DedA with SNARE-associated domain